MKAVIYPGRSAGKPIRIPGSKSISHRALIAASLAAGNSQIYGLVENKDTEATMRCLRCLGADFEHTADGSLLVHGTAGILSYNGESADCGESGSTLRFLIPLFGLCEDPVVLKGHGKLMERPQSVYEELFLNQGLLFQKDGDKLMVQGPLRPDTFPVRGNVSSQFISGLLFALPLMEGDSVIHILPPYESRSYVGLTEDVLEGSGIILQEEGNLIRVAGNQLYESRTFQVGGDDSQAAFFAVYALLSGMPVTVLGIPHDSRQGDHVIVSLIEQAGGKSIPIDGGYRFEPGDLKPICADLADCPDLGPVLFALASRIDGTSVFTNCARLRIKESDRIAAMKEELTKLGAELTETRDTVTIKGQTSMRGGITLSGHNDHRIVMALSLLGSSAEEPIVIEGAEAVSKSYPEFFRDLSDAGAEVDYGS